MSEQLIYTLCRAGVGITAGYGVYSSSEGMSAADRNEIENKYSLYSAPESIPVSGPGDPNIRRMPVSLGFARLSSGSECITRQIYTGADYDNPSRMGNYISHSVTDPGFGFYPIAALGFGGFVSDMHYEEMDCDAAPPALPPIDMGSPDALERVSGFVRTHDPALLRELAYRTLEAMDDRLRRAFVAEGKDDADWIGAVTMLLPLRLSKKIPFITYTGTPERCFHKLAGVYDEAGLPPSVSVFTVSSRRPFDAEGDPLFDSYIDSAYGEGSLREEFFAFLERIGWESPGRGIVDAYHLFQVCEKGAVPPKGPAGALRALKEVLGRATDDDIMAVYRLYEGAMDDDSADFFSRKAAPALKDRALADRVTAGSLGYVMGPLREIAEGRALADAYKHYSDPASECLRLGAAGMLDFPAGRYMCLRLWSETGSERAAAVLSGSGPMEDLVVEASVADGRTCVSAVTPESPLSREAKDAFKGGLEDRIAKLPRRSLEDLFRIGLLDDPLLATVLAEGVADRSDGAALEEAFMDSAIAAGETGMATSIAVGYIEAAASKGRDLSATVRAVKERTSGLGPEAASGLISAIAKSIDFTGFGPLDACVEAAAAFPDMDKVASHEDASRLRLLIAADGLSARGSTVGAPDVSSLSEEDVRRFVDLCLPGPMPKKHCGAWIEERMKYFGGCSTIAAERMGKLARNHIGSYGADAEAVEALFRCSEEIGADPETAAAQLTLDNRTKLKIAKGLPEEMVLLLGIPEEMPSDSGEKKGMDALKGAEGIKKAGSLLKGLFKRRSG